MTANGRVRFSVRATGDPSAGVQSVWVTWTGGPGDDGKGEWKSIDLTQDPADSTHWTGQLDAGELREDQLREDLRFVVQAANGAGAVGLDTNDGDGYEVGVLANTETSTVSFDAVTPPAPGSPLGVSATVTNGQGGPDVGRSVLFTVLQDGSSLFEYPATTDGSGRAVLGLPAGESLPQGAFTVSVFIFDGAGLVSDFDDVTVDTAAMSVATGVSGTPLGVVATVTDFNGGPYEGRTVRWTVKRGGAISTPVTARPAQTALSRSPATRSAYLPAR